MGGLPSQITIILLGLIQKMKIVTHRKMLTPRETEVMDLVSQGKSNWDISRILGCSEHTISNHISSILKKLNASNRAHAVAKAIFKGVISINVVIMALFINSSDIDIRRGVRRPSRRRFTMITAATMRIVEPYYIPDRFG